MEGETKDGGVGSGWIDVQLTAEDYRQFSVAVRGSTLKQVGVMVPWIAVAATVGYTLGQHAEPWMFVLLALGFASLYPGMRMRQRIARDAVAHAIRNGTGRIRIASSGLEFESRSRRVWQSSSSFVEVRERQDIVLVMQSQSSAWIIPKRSFASDGEANDFVQEARRWIDDDGPLEVLDPRP